MIAVIAFLGYRSVLEKLGGSNSTVLNCLRETDCIDQFELADRFTFLSLNKPVTEWLDEVTLL